MVTELLEICHLLNEQVQALKDEIAILKGQKAKPKISPSNLGKPPQGGVEIMKRAAASVLVLKRKAKLLIS